MTLVVPRKRPPHHKKTIGKHHRHTKTYHKAYWPYLPLIAIVIVGIILSNVSWIPGKHSVLSYATSMSIQELLDDTNQQRISNGLGALALNGQLDSAAQAKANDMSIGDYWAHTSPTGKTPWTFISAAGYNYQLAGENLAYGFGNAQDTLTGWMNSPGHRANILNGGYTAVGFGFINVANYHALVYNNTTGAWEQSNPSGGSFTIVVAMYGASASAPVQTATPPPAAPAPAAKQSVAQSGGGSSSQSSAGSAADSAPDTNDTATPAGTDTPTSANDDKTAIVVPSNVELKNVQEPQQVSVKRSQLLTAGKAPWSGLAVALIGAGAMALFFLRHAVAWHRVIRHGEQLILRHPILDSIFVAAAMLALILSHTAGVIR
jgi:hypothetical protein